ncbi:type II toxin-antitoxin system HigB family toxin [Duganella sp. FT135W]|uniref:Type II toxin-antitoxin system HigB family toxin n=1 Tax=Duganella flavida TaxID=2692175 RepID=A0A6L8K5J3_9BURK|nr:type II toxin-antitoxin system HigB family toxin [Duganella flavida]MYM21777.1 type II toxin-antitoxin system HigB family toxin [Duganella flavida]
MNLIATHLIDQFCLRHPNARVSLARWMQVSSAFSFLSFQQLKKIFPHADYVAPFTIFNVGGNNYRVISSVKYGTNTLEIRWVFPHAEYDKWARQFRSRKTKL